MEGNKNVSKHNHSYILYINIIEYETRFFY